MSRERRIELIRQIERLTDSKVLVYFVGDRGITQAQIAEDTLRPMYDQLRTLKPQISSKPNKRLCLYLYSTGGQMETPWKMATLLREFCDELWTIIPAKAYSAATMLVMSADKILMTDLARLGPIDPIVCLAPQPGGPSFAFPDLGVEDVAAYIRFARDRFGLTDQSALGQAMMSIANTLRPEVLGRLERIYSHIRLVASKLLSLHQPAYDQERTQKIIQTLTEKSYVHGHGISRREAQEIGLDVECLNEEQIKDIWNLFLLYEEWLQLESCRDPNFYFKENSSDIYLEKDAVIAVLESTEHTHVYECDLELKRVRNVPPNPQINLNLSLTLPPIEPPREAGQVPDQVYQKLLPWIAEQVHKIVPGIVQQELARQSPVVDIQRRTMNGRWILSDFDK